MFVSAVRFFLVFFVTAYVVQVEAAAPCDLSDFAKLVPERNLDPQTIARLDPSARELLGSAQELAFQYKSTQVEAAHILLAAIGNPQSKLAKSLATKGINITELGDFLKLKLDNQAHIIDDVVPKKSGGIFKRLRRGKVPANRSARSPEDLPWSTELKLDMARSSDIVSEKLSDEQLLALAIRHNDKMIAEMKSAGVNHEVLVGLAHAQGKKSLINRLDLKRVAGVEDDLNKTVYGQAPAVRAVARVVNRVAAGADDPGKPKSVFMFLGPSGSGKTFLFERLAKWFGIQPSNGSLHTIDMANYMDASSISKMTGTAPGYVGFEQGGELTTFLAKHQFDTNFVLFDEVEKANPKVMDVMLSAFDQGRVVSGQGQKLSMKNSFIAMTSNVAAEEMATVSRNIKKAIEAGASEADVKKLYDDFEKLARKRLVEEGLRPELVNRIEFVIPFDVLPESIHKKMVADKFTEISKRFLPNARISDSAQAELAKLSSQSERGARSVPQVMFKEFFDDLAIAKNRGQIGTADVIEIFYDAASASFKWKKL